MGGGGGGGVQRIGQPLLGRGLTKALKQAWIHPRNKYIISFKNPTWPEVHRLTVKKSSQEVEVGLSETTLVSGQGET